MSSVPITASVSVSALPQNELLWRCSVEKYHQMIRAGIFTDDAPIELLEGLLVRKMTKNPPHTISTTRARHRLEEVIPAGWYVNSQEPITLDDSEPEPDVFIARGAFDDYITHHPFAEDVALVIEVADSTLERDRTTKRRVYARAGIPIYWIINLVGRGLEVYTNPTGQAEEPDYQESQIFADDNTVPLRIDGREIAQIAVRTLLP